MAASDIVFCFYVWDGRRNK